MAVLKFESLSCRIDGVFAPVGTAPTARPINFRVILPASWNRRAAQLGGGGINGVIPNLTGVEFGAAGSSPGTGGHHLRRVARATDDSTSPYDTPNRRRITSPRYRKIFLSVAAMKSRLASRPRIPSGGV